MGCIGADCGTFNLVVARRDEEKNIKSRKEVNAFIELPLENRYMFNMMKKAGVPLIERDNVAYIVGESAVNMAYTLNLEMKRPMQDGCLNPKEKDAYRILTIMLHSLIGETAQDKTTLYYSVPANATNQETDADYHQKVLQSIFKAYKMGGHSLDAHPINEALALIYAELAHKNFTGIGLSFGAGMCNLCYAIFSQPVFSLSLVNSGDWIDKQAAKACSESPNVINKEKMKVDLTKTPKNLVERAIISQYRIMIEKVAAGIKKAFTEAGTKVRTEQPLDIVISGGTSGVGGFTEVFKEVVEQAQWAVPIGQIIHPEDYLYSVSRGCLAAAEAAQ